MIDTSKNQGEDRLRGGPTDTTTAHSALHCPDSSGEPKVCSTPVAHFAKRRRENVQGFQQDEVAVCHVCGCCGRKAGVCQYLHHTRLRITLSITTDNIVCTTSLDDEMKEGAHGAFTSEMMKLPQATWIATFLEGTTDKST